MRDTFYLPTDKILLDFKKYLTDKGFSKPSVTYYMSDARVFLASCSQESPMVFTESAIKDYLALLKSRNVNPTTVKRKNTALKHLQLFLIENGFIIETTKTKAVSGLVNPQMLALSFTSALAGAALSLIVMTILSRPMSVDTRSMSANFAPIGQMSVSLTKDAREVRPIVVNDQSPFMVNIDTEDQSSGRATIKANKNFVDVYGNISEEDLVFVSPVSIQNGLSYAVPVVTDGYFRIQLSATSTQETVLNWQIVKQSNTRY